MYRDIELRKLPVAFLSKVIDILEINDDWKRVMCIIPSDPHGNCFEPKYNNEHIRLIEDDARATHRKGAEILFAEWGTSGPRNIRPTLGMLQKIILQAEIYRAADEIALLLQEAPPLRPGDGPAASIDTNITCLLNNESMEQRLNAMDSIKSDNFSNYTSKQSNHDQAICNQTTAQMKSASDMIKFSTNIDSTDIPNVSALQSLGSKTTAQIKSESDLIKFSKLQLPTITIDEPTLESANIPNLSAIMSSTQGTDKETTSVIPTISQIESSQEINILSQNQTSNIKISSDYQKSLPNIEFFESDKSGTLEDDTSGIDSQILQDTNLIQFQYKDLEIITNKFSEIVINGSNGPVGRIGSGGFGEVFAGFHPNHGPLAVKKAHNHIAFDRKPEIAMKVFNAEVKYLSQFKHKNIVPILGYSRDGPTLCIVCEYIDGGSLEEKIAAKVLNENQRIDIMLGTAEGLKYLHTSEKSVHSNLRRTSESDSQSSSKKNNFIHGDVKSANILLTRDCIPKLCDFGLAKQFDTTFITSSLIGTNAYMAPEGFSGTITQKNDIYSYGIVLLELLTGLRPIVTNDGDTINIKDYIEENCTNNDITKLLDPIVDKWTRADQIYNLARSCLEQQRKSRPSIDDISDILHRINSNKP